MTIAKLHKALGELINQGYSRQSIAIDKLSFIHPLEDEGCTILPVEDLEIEAVINADEDGGAKINKDGTESYSRILILRGTKKQCVQKR